MQAEGHTVDVVRPFPLAVAPTDRWFKLPFFESDSPRKSRPVVSEGHSVKLRLLCKLIAIITNNAVSRLKGFFGFSGSILQSSFAGATKTDREIPVIKSICRPYSYRANDLHTADPGLRIDFPGLLFGRRSTAHLHFFTPSCPRISPDFPATCLEGELIVKPHILRTKSQKNTVFLL